MNYTLFFAILTSLLIGYFAGAFVMAFRIIKDSVVVQLTGHQSKRLKILQVAVTKAVDSAREEREV